MPVRPAAALVVAFLLLGGMARAAAAQQVTPFLPLTQPAAQPRPEPPPAPAPPADSQTQMTGVSLTRIRRLLREQPPVVSDSKLTLVDSRYRVEYHVKVVGRMPFRFGIIGDFNIDKKSAVPYGGMTHSEFLKVVAPPWRKW